MSWREVLGAANSAEDPYTHKSHNLHKTPDPDISADYAVCAEKESKLLEILATATRGLSITPSEVRDALTSEDIQNLNKGNIHTETLAAFARSLVQRWQMDQSKVPAHFTERATCKQCGPVWLWFTGEVQGCPWCRNRVAGRPIPRPQAIYCRDCAHFERIDHPHLGHCTKCQPEAIAGLWDTDQRYCERYLPNQKK